MTAGQTPGGGAAASAIELLSSLPGLESAGIREALLLTAALDRDLADDISTAGSPAEFAAAAVEACMRAGAPAGRLPALVALLEASSVFGDAAYHSRVQRVAAEVERELRSPQRQWQTFLGRLGLTEGAAPVRPPPDGQDELVPANPDADPDDLGAEILARERAVVLLGEAHADPAAAGVRLLWRAFRDRGLEPRWLTATAFEAWAQEPGNLPRQADRIVPSGSAVHVLEPFDATAPTDLEQLLADLHDLVGEVAQRESLLVVTSTNPVFSRAARSAFPPLVADLPPPPAPDAEAPPADAVARWPPARLLAVLVVDLLADSDASAADAAALYRAVAGAAAAQSWDEALAAARDAVVDQAALRPFPFQLRHSALRGVLRSHMRASADAADLGGQLVARAAAEASLSVRLAALRALLREPLLRRQRQWAAAVLDALLNSPDTLVRRQARFTTIASLPEMSADLRATVLADARQHWNDRFLLRLALHGDLTDRERAGLVGRLARSWDRWVRSVTARNLHHLGADPAVLSLVLRDEDRQVAREAARAVLTHREAWADAAADPADLLSEELRRDPSIRPLLDRPR
jgi:hypothetical protein